MKYIITSALLLSAPLGSRLAAADDAAPITIPASAITIPASAIISARAAAHVTASAVDAPAFADVRRLTLTSVYGWTLAINRDGSALLHYGSNPIARADLPAGSFTLGLFYDALRPQLKASKSLGDTTVSIQSTTITTTSTSTTAAASPAATPAPAPAPEHYVARAATRNLFAQAVRGVPDQERFAQILKEFPLEPAIPPLAEVDSMFFSVGLAWYLTIRADGSADLQFGSLPFDNARCPAGTFVISELYQTLVPQLKDLPGEGEMAIGIRTAADVMVLPHYVSRSATKPILARVLQQGTASSKERFAMLLEKNPIEPGPPALAQLRAIALFAGPAWRLKIQADGSALLQYGSTAGVSGICPPGTFAIGEFYSAWLTRFKEEPGEGDAQVSIWPPPDGGPTAIARFISRSETIPLFARAAQFARTIDEEPIDALLKAYPFEH